MTKMRTRLIALVSAAVIAVGAAAPASALSEREQNALALILGAVAIGAVINEANKNSNRRAPVTSRSDSGYWTDGRYGNDRSYEDDHGYPTGRGYRTDDDERSRFRKGRTIPQACTFPIRSNGGRQSVVSARCLSEYGIDRHLPRDCAFNVRVGYENRRVFGARCLQRNGFKIAGLR